MENCLAFPKKVDIKILNKCLVIENVKPVYPESASCLTKLERLSIISLLRNILATLIKSKALFVKFLSH